MVRALAFISIAALAACADREEPDRDPPPPSGYNMIDDVQVNDPGGLVGAQQSPATATTPGVWRPDTVGAMRGVSFVPPEGEPLLRMFCDGRRGMVVERTALVPSGEIDMMTFRVRDRGRQLAVNPTGPDGTVLRAMLPLRGDLIAALQAGPAPIQVSVGEGAPLSLPPSPLVAMLATDCSKV